jgi:putative transposase
VRFAYIHQHRRHYPVAKLCTVLHVSRSGYYDWSKRKPSERKERRVKLTRNILRIFNQSKQVYGSRKVKEQLAREGEQVSERTVRTIMQENKLKSKTVRKYKATTNSNHQLPVYENVVNQQFNVPELNKVWVGDITYIATSEGWLYLASVMDLCTRKIVGWQISDRMTKDLVIHALERAYARQRPGQGLVFHSDRGTQYASHDFQNKLKMYQMKPSMSRKGNCYDNACIEAFHSVLKKELVYPHKFKTRVGAKKHLFDYIECFYNSNRIHGTIGYLTPNEFEKKLKEAA